MTPTEITDAIKRARELEKQWIESMQRADPNEVCRIERQIMDHATRLADLLESQQAEVEELKKSVSWWGRQVADIATATLKQRDELRSENASLKQRVADLEKGRHPDASLIPPLMPNPTDTLVHDIVPNERRAER